MITMTLANKLTNEELATVNGGCLYETADDSKFLNVLLRGTSYHRCDRQGKTSLFLKGGGYDVQESWTSLGIDAYCDDGGLRANKYGLNGKEITRDEAWDYAEKVVGKHLNRADWDW